VLDAGRVLASRLVPKLAAVAVVLAAVAAVLLVVERGEPVKAPTAGSDRVAVQERPTGARGVLADWDRARAEAWAAGDVTALADLYVPGSRAGARDVRSLQRWVDRGLVVEDLRVQVLSFEVRLERARRLVVDVTDRVVGGTATGGGRSEVLPDDQPSSRRITFVRRKDAWRVAEVVDVP
jgi:hypothetical protein